ncbi:MAG: hypothetical protein ACOYN7_07755 [Candidatus Nanopelagicales bacterium]
MARRAASALACLTLIAAITATPATAATAPPFEGTVWIGPNIITPASPSDLLSTEPAGRGNRTTYDRRSGWVTQDAYLFIARFTGSKPAEIIVNPEFGSPDAAATQAGFFARILGQLPRSCRTRVDALWIHPGNESLGGGNRSILIYSDFANGDRAFLEEALLHECAHTSLDWDWGGTVERAKWAAQAARDPGFISSYAADNPTSEDVAETFVPYLVWKLGAASGYTAAQLAAISQQIPNRLAYLDSLALNLAPLIAAEPSTTPKIRPGSACKKAFIGHTTTTVKFGTLTCRRGGNAIRWQR